MDLERDVLLAPLGGRSPCSGEPLRDDLDRGEGDAHRHVHDSLHRTQFCISGKHKIFNQIFDYQVALQNVVSHFP